jgi:hypothetical protein
MLKEVKVFRTDLWVDVLLTVRPDRLEEFLAMAKEQPVLSEPVPVNFNEGISGAATIGVCAIFTYIPQRFPMLDILRFLANEAGINLSITHAALEIFGSTHSGLYGNGDNIV